MLRVIEYDADKFPFQSLIKGHLEKVLESSNFQLTEFHRYIPKEKMPKDKVEGTAHTYGHDLLYSIDKGFKQAKGLKATDIGFMDLYKNFLKNFWSNIFGYEFVYQTKPSLRIHYPGYTSYGIFHTDAEYNHPNGETNVWVPITEARETASMWIESEIGKGDYKPVNLKFGEALIFDGRLKHGNLVNEEGYTRFSLDFRVIEKEKLKIHSQKESVTQGVKFCLGSYYEELINL